MSRGLEAKTEDISKLLYEVYDVPSGICEYIDKVLQRLEQIDNARVFEKVECSEALECLEKLEELVQNIENVYESPYSNGEESYNDLNTIKQALIQAENNRIKLEKSEKIISRLIDKKSKKELAWDIAKNKLVDVFKLYNCKTVEEYNQAQYRDCKLTEEEFELLKEVLCDD